MNEPSQGNHQRSLAAVISDLKQEFKEFVDTRVRIIRAEIQETAGAARRAAIFFGMALFLGLSGSFLLTLALVAAIYVAFLGNPYAWCFALIIVGCLWLILGGVAAFLAYNAIRGRFPKRTVEVLRADKIWIQSEVRGM